ncbi:hypothetical protein B0J13DRAFT_522213 [Dactylonectria estremocensis]|uniref:Uncharacterized protein n=1 Tax=Dactylonectria estremocensis TaxID=1079267 RepID=A0A9P9F2D6_9HYPO|nr:hypothetical protein B0J13DRAFT_522213 [Dactylonectria estremocensis]
MSFAILFRAAHKPQAAHPSHLLKFLEQILPLKDAVLLPASHLPPTAVVGAGRAATGVHWLSWAPEWAGIVTIVARADSAEWEEAPDHPALGRQSPCKHASGPLLGGRRALLKSPVGAARQPGSGSQIGATAHGFGLSGSSQPACRRSISQAHKPILKPTPAAHCAVPYEMQTNGVTARYLRRQLSPTQRNAMHPSMYLAQNPPRPTRPKSNPLPPPPNSSRVASHCALIFSSHLIPDHTTLVFAPRPLTQDPDFSFSASLPALQPFAPPTPTPAPATTATYCGLPALPCLLAGLLSRSPTYSPSRPLAHSPTRLLASSPTSPTFTCSPAVTARHHTIHPLRSGYSPLASPRIAFTFCAPVRSLPSVARSPSSALWKRNRSASPPRYGIASSLPAASHPLPVLVLKLPRKPVNQS